MEGGGADRHGQCEALGGARPSGAAGESITVLPEDAPGLPTGHGPKKKDQHADGHERERGAREKLRYTIEALAAPGLHECEQGQNEPDAVTGQRDGDGGLRAPACRGRRKRTADQTEPKEEKRREPKFAQAIQC